MLDDDKILVSIHLAVSSKSLAVLGPEICYFFTFSKFLPISLIVVNKMTRATWAPKEQFYTFLTARLNEI